MMRLRVAAGVLAVLLLIGFAAASLPARLAARWIDRDLLALSGVQGSVWRGSAARAVLATDVGPLQLGELHWRVHPWSMVFLSPRLTLDSQWGSQRIASRVWRRGQRWELRDVDAVVDARLLRLLLPIDVKGRISVQLDALSALPEERIFDASGRVVWQDALWQTASAAVPLGSYVALLDSDGDAQGTISARIDTLSGPLLAQGELRLVQGRYAVDARLEAPAGMDPQLSRALSLIAEPRENGYLLRLDGDVANTP